MSQLANKIEAHDRTIFQVLNEKKYTVITADWRNKFKLAQEQGIIITARGKD